MAEFKGKVLVTPAGEVAYPKINKPDEPEFGGDYKIKLKLPLEQAKPIVAAIKEVAAEAYPPAKLKGKVNYPYKVLKEEGLVEFNFRSKFKPGVFDASGAEITDELKIGGGTSMKAKVHFLPAGPKAPAPGIKGYLKAVQVIKLVEYKPKSAFGDARGEAGEEAFVAAEHVGFEDETVAPKAAPVVSLEDDDFSLGGDDGEDPLGL